MKVVLVMFKDDERREFPIKAGITVFGRRADCGLRIPTGDVSRQHCEIAIGDNDVQVKDLGSSNGTFVNGKRVAESPVRAGDRLAIGPVVFVVQIDGQPAQINPADAKPEHAVPTGGGGIDDLDEILQLDDSDFDMDDAITTLEEPDEDK